VTPWQQRVADWRDDPVRFVRDHFKVEPDCWQADALTHYLYVPRLCMKAAKGPGKSAVLAWIGWHFLLCFPHSMIGATSISADNLKSCLWTELARWRMQSPLLTELFEQTKTEIFAKDHPRTWRLEARTWAKDADANAIGNALAGLQAKYVMWLGDEAGDYPDAIMPTFEGIFAGEPAEAHIAIAGNPTKLGGPLYRACTTAQKLCYVVEITGDPDDPRRSSRISLQHAREQIEQYGRDNPWVLVNVFGQFPPSSLNALIGPDEVREAQKRFYREYEIGAAAKVIGVDVARFGDDKSVIAKRQGIQMFPFRHARNVDSTTGAGWVTREANEWGAHATFVDDTGGFGAGWIDQMRALGQAPIGIHFASEASNKTRYANKRTEMYFEFVEWIKRGGALPDCPELSAALTQTTYTFKGDRLILEPKDDIKAKLGYSPDEADAAALSFAHPVAAPYHRPRYYRQMEEEYNPYREMDADRGSSYTHDYNPFKERW
jgi:phage terminase large subunit